MSGDASQNFGDILFEDINSSHFAIAIAAVAGAMIYGWILAFRRGVRLVSLASMTAFTTSFSAASAGLPILLASAISSAQPAEPVFLAAAYLVSRIAGFLVPGAPGGSECARSCSTSSPEPGQPTLH